LGLQLNAKGRGEWKKTEFHRIDKCSRDRYFEFKGIKGEGASDATRLTPSKIALCQWCRRVGAEPVKPRPDRWEEGGGNWDGTDTNGETVIGWVILRLANRENEKKKIKKKKKFSRKGSLSGSYTWRLSSVSSHCGRKFFGGL